MIKQTLFIVALGAGLAIAPTVSRAIAAPAPQRATAQYHFRAADQAKLRDHYRGNFRENDHIDVANRAGFKVGMRLSGDWRARIHHCGAGWGVVVHRPRPDHHYRSHH